MAESIELIIILAVVYFLECLQVVPRRAVAVQMLIWRRFSARSAWPMGLWRGAALVLGMPLPPMGLLFVVEDWPVILDENELVGEDGVGRVWPSALKATAKQLRVVVNGGTVATLASESAAVALARALRLIARGEPAERKRLVDDVMAARMDGAAVRRRVDAFRRAVWPLRLAESLLFVALFAGAPLIFLTELSGSWREIAGAGVLAWVATLVTFHRALRRCFPGADGPPLARVIMLALWPLAAMRGSDVLGRTLLHDVDPLAAATLLAPEGFSAAARRALAELQFGVERRSAWFDERRRRAILRLLDDQRTDPDALFTPPAPDEPAVRAFCPRCRSQYVTESACCASCPGIRVLPIAPIGRAT